MIKQFIRYIFIGILVLFSFFYTNKSVELLKSIDPIMKKIKSNSEKYEIETVNAKIDDDTIIPGYSGIKIDINKSYSNMKKMNKYNPNYYVFKESIPTISIVNNNDKYITRGNYLKDEVALIFKINKNSDLVPSIYSILESKDVIGNFFVDGVYIKNNEQEIYRLVDSNHEIEVLGYNNELSEDSLMMVRNNLENIVNYSGNYCLLNNKNADILKMCSKNNMYTVCIK